MDRTVRPGDDFFDYALGSWLKTAKIPDDQACVGVDNDIDYEVTDDLKSIVESRLRRTHRPTVNIQQIGDLYASYMDEAALEQHGVLSRSSRYLAAIDGVTDKAGLDAVLVQFNEQLSVPDPFPTAVRIDPNEPTRYHPGDLAGRAVPRRPRVLPENKMPNRLSCGPRSPQHVARLLGLAGYADAAAQAQQVLSLQTKLAEVQWPLEDTFDVDKTSTIMTRQEVEKLGTGAPLQAMFDALRLPAQTDFQVAMPDVLVKTAALFADQPVDAWKAYLRYQLLSEYARYLSKPFADERFSFYGRVLAGTETRLPRWKVAIDYATDAMGDALGQPYVAEHFTQATKDQALELVEHFLDRLRGRHRQRGMDVGPTKIRPRQSSRRWCRRSDTPTIGSPTMRSRSAATTSSPM